MPVFRPLIEALTVAFAFACCPDAGFKEFNSSPYLCLVAFACCPDAGPNALNCSLDVGLGLCLLPRCWQLKPLPWPLPLLAAPAPALRLLVKALTLASAFACCPDAGFKAFN